MNVGVMKDYKLRDLRASHTLGWSWYYKSRKRELKAIAGINIEKLKASEAERKKEIFRNGDEQVRKRRS